MVPLAISGRHLGGGPWIQEGSWAEVTKSERNSIMSVIGHVQTVKNLGTKLPFRYPLGMLILSPLAADSCPTN